MSSPYNSSYWSKRIPFYQSQAWSRQPTPFAEVAAGYLKSGARILELGAGAGQDSLWFAANGFDVTVTDGTDVGFAEIKARAAAHNLSCRLLQLDITQPFPLETDAFDLIYAQIVLNYFDDATLAAIIEEIKRVLKPGALLACVLNSTSDPEYDASKADVDGLIDVHGLVKRYFDMPSFQPFVKDFEPLLFDCKGKTPKDDSVGTTGLLRFVGRNTQAVS